MTASGIFHIGSNRTVERRDSIGCQTLLQLQSLGEWCFDSGQVQHGKVSCLDGLRAMSIAAGLCCAFAVGLGIVRRPGARVFFEIAAIR